MPIRRIGDWRLAHRILSGAPRRIQRAIDKAVLQEAHFMRGEIVKGLKDQAPGGQRFKPLAKSTLAVRRFKRFRGTKALLNRGDLRNSIAVHRIGGGSAFVGVLRSARGRKGQPLANIAELNEFGSRPIVIRVTPKMRRFLAMALSKSGGGSGGGGGSGTGIIVVQIPARPFISPVAEKHYANKSEVANRFARRVGVLLMGDFGGPGVPGSGGGVRAGGGGSRRRGGGGGGIVSFVSKFFGGSRG